MEPFGTDPSVYTGIGSGAGPERIQTDPKTGPTVLQVQFLIRLSRINRRHIRSDFRTGSIWNRGRVNIALVTVTLLASGKTDYHCKIKETLLIQELKPAFNVNVSSEKLMLY